jgi:DNA end-binding protein Ku
MNMARALWKGSISFGLVEIPVALVTGTSDEGDLSFAQIDRRNMARVGYQRVNKETGEEVPWAEIVRGYEYEPDEYVILSDADIASANVKASKTVEIVNFVDQKEIDPVFYDKPYFLEPLKKDSKSYALLRTVLEKSGKVGIARVVLRTREYLSALLVRKGVLVLNLLRYPAELKDPKDIQVPGDIEVSPAELKMAERLVQGMTEKFNPKQFHDQYREDVMKMIEKRVKAGQVESISSGEEAEEAKPGAEIKDLMPLLKKSLESHDARGSGAPKKAAAPKAAAKATATKKAVTRTRKTSRTA